MTCKSAVGVWGLIVRCDRKSGLDWQGLGIYDSGKYD